MTEQALNPKTFQIRIRNLFPGHTSPLPYSFYIHTETYEEACDWVESVFCGINTNPARQKLVEPYVKGKIGNSDQVSIIDCDMVSDLVWRNGKRVSVTAPLGKHRKTKRQISEELLDVSRKLKEDYNIFRRSVSYYDNYDRMNNKDLMGLSLTRARMVLCWMEKVFKLWVESQESVLYPIDCSRIDVDTLT